MPGQSLEFGRQAEGAAFDFLKSQGYKILVSNYKTKFGEVDIIAQEKKVICFVEVKARHSLSQGDPAEAVTVRKQRQISKAAICYLKSNNLLDHPARFDVVTLLEINNSIKISLIKDAFELSANFTI